MVLTAVAFSLSTFAQSLPSGSEKQERTIPRITINHTTHQSFQKAVAERKAIGDIHEIYPPDGYKVVALAIINSGDFLIGLNAILEKESGKFTPNELAVIVRGFHFSELGTMVRAAANLPVGAAMETDEAGAAVFSVLIAKEARLAVAGSIIVAATMVCSTALLASPNDDASKQIADECTKIIGVRALFAAATVVFFDCIALNCHTFDGRSNQVNSSSEKNDNKAQTKPTEQSNSASLPPEDPDNSCGEYDLPKPTVSNERLSNIIDDLYKGLGSSRQIGSGSTADAIRYERANNLPVEGTWHTVKGSQYASALENWLRKYPQAAPDDIEAARLLLDDLRRALSCN